MVFLGVVEEQTMQKLEEVLDGYESVEVVPSLFIFLGNFCSHPCNLAFYNFFELRSQFEQLGSLIASRPRIKDASRFLFIPGPGDPGPANVLPRPALPKFFTDEILKHLPNSIFGSNPCRIRFYSQEIVLFREDLQYQMRRSCICTPSEDETSDPFEHVSHPWLLFAFPYDSIPFKIFGFLPVMQQSLHYGLTPHLRSTNLVHPPSQV
jgi:DNA polymerase epsilon subunit 2